MSSNNVKALIEASRRFLDVVRARHSIPLIERFECELLNSLEQATNNLFNEMEHPRIAYHNKIVDKLPLGIPTTEALWESEKSISHLKTGVSWPWGYTSGYLQVEQKPNEIKSPFQKACHTMVKTFKEESYIAWGWHDNVASACLSEGVDYHTANRIASRFMKMAFDVVTVKPSERFKPTSEEVKVKQPYQSLAQRLQESNDIQSIGKQLEGVINTSYLKEATPSILVLRGQESDE